MPLLNFWKKRVKPLSQMTRQELRRQELLLDKDRGTLLKKIEKLSAAKETLFKRGASEKVPEVRRMLAQEFELRTSEQLMLARELNIRGKEAMTVTRMRMLREQRERAGSRGRPALVSEKDLMRLGKLIESDAISAEMYQERLDQILAIGAEVDQGGAALSDAGREVMDIWDKMDTGLIADETEAFDEADRRVRERQAPAES